MPWSNGSKPFTGTKCKVLLLCSRTCLWPAMNSDIKYWVLRLPACPMTCWPQDLAGILALPHDLAYICCHGHTKLQVCWRDHQTLQVCWRGRLSLYKWHGVEDSVVERHGCRRSMGFPKHYNARCIAYATSSLISPSHYACHLKSHTPDSANYVQVDCAIFRWHD